MVIDLVRVVRVLRGPARILRQRGEMLRKMEWLSSERGWLAAKPRAMRVAIVLMALGLTVGSGAVAWFAYVLTAGLPTRAQVRALGDMAQSTTILDAHDVPAFAIFKEQRLEVPLDRMSSSLIKAVVSVANQRFYDHKGVDFVRVASAAVRNLHERRRADCRLPIDDWVASPDAMADAVVRRRQWPIDNRKSGNLQSPINNRQ